MELETRITVRMSEKDKKRLMNDARDNRIGFSEYIRALLGIKG